MTRTRSEAETVLQDGIAALRAGNAKQARPLFEQLSQPGNDIDPPWLLLAHACRMMDDNAAEEQALQALLATDKRHLAALLLMAELKARQDDDRAASAFYKAALNMVGVGARVSDDLRPKLKEAEEFLAGAHGRFENYLLRQLRETGLQGNDTPIPIRNALDLLMGRKEIFYQKPSMFYYPGMPQREFYEREEFPWVEQMEAAIPDMQDELAQVLSQTTQFDPYVKSHPDRPRPNNPLLDDSNWGAHYFWKNGEAITDNIAQCPKTIAALETAPIPVIQDRSPMALYSVLEPDTHIAPHFGLLNTRLICHIPLIIPSDCALRVGSETRPWKEGEALIFDDSFEHEAWNRSQERRVILLFEVWRPEISETERAALTTIFEAINEYQKPVDIGI
ncbi:aspartyl/asparaginyl beta-hydroxylase domain-containing protein [Parasphingorhabdus cellanae]|uniref:Aspartyl/asparaginyl beta-hydroxylase domain-containing protein n=1 Tax=Parasphingorhabdus cellanae TaxID=2806553 RepID=A0ABX7T347_9SPHN|nr:aspartyl/asparaginyl beta-hydroxylase domain-containing protein [Parasphingorhabdus cellanae]QTD55990.1 aspartyl/asparaginyl beta-hydroxylase domain-containing protein [Parasphingorhabdus cellanae]